MSEMNSIDGFYIAYFTGVIGTSIGIFVFKEGIVVGADAGGGRYNGVFNISEDAQSIIGTIDLTIPIGMNSITGVSATTEPIAMSVPFELPTQFNRHDVFKIQTPAGPINAKFEKMRDF